MKYYSPEARTTLLELHNEFSNNVLFSDDGKYQHRYLNNYGVYYHPDEGMFYDTASAAFKDLPYEVIEYYCSGWTGYLEGVETYEDLEVYARDFGVKILSQEEYNAIEEEDEDVAYNIYHESWKKVITVIADELINSWHSLCVIKGKRCKAHLKN